MTALQAMRKSLFWVSVPIFFINFALPVKSKALGASAFEIGGLFSLFTLSLLLFRPVIGIALDRYGRRWFLLIALSLYGVSYAGYGLAGNIEWMYAARLLQGLGAALLLLTVDAITADLAPEAERASAMGQNVEAQTRSTFVGATIGFSLVAVFPVLGWKISFLLFTALAFYAMFVAVKNVPESIPTATLPDNADGSAGALQNLLIMLVPLGFASALMMPVYLVYLQDEFTPDVRLLSWAFLPAGLVFAILPSKLGSLVDRYGAIWPCCAGLVTTAALYFLLPEFGNYWAVVGVYTLSSVGWAVIEPARKAMTAQLAGERVAKGFGLAEMCFGFGAVAGPLAGGYLYDHYSHALPFYLNGGMMLIAAVLLLALIRPKLSRLQNSV
tara:strand:+ start:9775 stop:10929 length:1155 start_codon:yes stop_codon:yes gene_type:complete